MGSDGRGDSRRRHRRSSSPSDEEVERTSKRHKHRHHRHSRSSRKHGEEIIDKGEDTNSPPPPQAPPSVHAPNSRPDDDLEEGEILDEEGLLSDEVKSAGQSNLQNLGDDAVQEKASDAEKGDDKFRLSADGIQNGKDFSIEADDSREKHKEPRLSPSKGNEKKKRHKDVDSRDSEDSPLTGRSRYLSHNYDERSKELLHSPHLGRYRNGDYVEDKEDSGEFVRERSRSQSILIGEDTHPKATRRGGSNSQYADKSRDYDYDSDDHRKARHNRDYRHGSRDILTSDVREESETRYNATHRGASDSYYADNSRDDCDSDDHRKTRHSRDCRHRSRDVQRSNGREESDNCIRDSRRDDVRRSRERDIDGDLRREEKEKKRDVEADRDYRKKRERERSMDREWEHEKKRDDRRESSRDMGIDRYKQREKERGRSGEKLRDRDRDRSKEKERDRSRDSKRERYTEREIKDKGRSTERKLEKMHSDNKNRDRDRDVESYKTKYESSKDGHRYSDKYRHAKHSGYDEQGNRHDESRKEDAREAYVVNKTRTEDGQSKLKSYDDEQQDMDDNDTLELTLDEEEDIEKIKEESRRRRQAIMEKYKNKPQVEKVQQQEVVILPENSSRGLPTESRALANAVSGPSEGRVTVDTDQSFSVRKSPQTNGSDADVTTGASGLGKGTPKSERFADMFYDDIFGESPTGVRRSGKGGGLQIERSGLHDNWDDAEGYYSHRFGEILDGRYEILSAHGKGVFSTVVRAKDLKAGIGEPQEVAVKILRNKEAMYKAGVEELGILNKLVGADPDDKRHCVRLLSSFKYRNHLCLVFESLSMNLREVLKKFGRNIGLKLTAVRTYAKQLFIALKHLRNCGVLHCDIKPDNMLVNEAKNVLKLCDFGNAMYAGKNEITPYLVSRFYRAPEIILGLPYDHPMDIWSVGCSLYELYTGKVLFPGPSNNDMLRLHMELKGSFPKKMLRKGGFIDQHYDQDLNFLATEEDPVTKKLIKRMILNIKPKDIGTIIKGSPGEDPKMLANFKDLLDKIFVLDPDKRMTVQQALSHPFITGK